MLHPFFLNDPIVSVSCLVYLAHGQSLAVVPVVPSAGVNVIPPVSDLPPRPAEVASRLSTLEAGHLAVIQAINDTVRTEGGDERRKRVRTPRMTGVSKVWC